MIQLFADPFAYTIPYNPIFDAARIFVIAVAVAILVRVGFVLLSGEAKSWVLSQRAGVCVFVGLSLQITTQEAQQLGKDLIWWRLPLLMFIGISAVVTLYSDQPTRGKDVNRSTTLYLIARAAVEDAFCDRDQLDGVPCNNPDHAHPNLKDRP